MALGIPVETLVPAASLCDCVLVYRGIVDGVLLTAPAGMGMDILVSTPCNWGLWSDTVYHDYYYGVHTTVRYSPARKQAKQERNQGPTGPQGDCGCPAHHRSKRRGESLFSLSQCQSVCCAPHAATSRGHFTRVDPSGESRLPDWPGSPSSSVPRQIQRTSRTKKKNQAATTSKKS